MKKPDKGSPSVSPLPPLRRRVRPSVLAARRNDLLRRGVLAALRRSGRYSVITNMHVTVPEAARELVRGFRRSVGAPPTTEARCDTVIIDMVVVDATNGWAGGYAFCANGAQSPRKRGRIEENLRAAEVVLAAHVSRVLARDIRTATVGIIDGSADPEESDDLTVAASEIADLFEVPFAGPSDESSGPPSGASL